MADFAGETKQVLGTLQTHLALVHLQSEDYTLSNALPTFPSSGTGGNEETKTLRHEILIFAV